MSRDIRTVVIIGCGVIGMSWAVLFLSRGLKVIITDPAEDAQERFEQYLSDAWPSVSTVDCLEGFPKNYEFVEDVVPRLAEADFVQEVSSSEFLSMPSWLGVAVLTSDLLPQNGPENVEWKQSLFETLDMHTRSGVIIASSSSGLPSSAFIGRCQNDPSRILVGHPFNPPHLIPLVEVVPHPGTDHRSIETTLEFYKSLGKRPIHLHQEIPGFVANRLQATINNEAYSLVSRGIVSAADLDAAVTSGPGLPWALTGPITTNALGGGGGAEGFDNRIDRLGQAIKGWEEDILLHRFDRSKYRLLSLQKQVQSYLQTVDWTKTMSERESVLMKLLAAKTDTMTMV
jgi:3-hydroxyacyl-CoA dehydrogenase